MSPKNDKYSKVSFGPHWFYSVHSVLFGLIWSYLVLFSTFCPLKLYSVYFEPIRFILSTLVLLGPFCLLWFYLVLFSTFCPLWSISVIFGPFGPLWSTSVLWPEILMWWQLGISKKAPLETILSVENSKFFVPQQISYFWRDIIPPKSKILDNLTPSPNSNSQPSDNFH